MHRHTSDHRTLRGAARALLVALTVVMGTGACTVVNRIDVCERTPPPERQLNLTDPVGFQFLEGPQSLAAMPSGRPMVVFTSVDSDETALGGEIRGSLLDTTGQPTATCGGEFERVYAAGDASIERRSAILAAPFSAVSRGLLAWVGSPSPGEDPQLMAHFLDSDACPSGDPFAVSADPSPRLPSIAAAGVGENRFVALWAPQSGTPLSGWPIRARVVERWGGEMAFLPTEGSLTGDAVDLPTPDVTNVAVSATTLDGPGRFAVAWVGAPIGHDRLYVRVFDDGLRPATDAVLVDESAQSSTGPMLSVSLAHERDRLFVAWTSFDGENARAHGAIVSTDGSVVRPAFALDATPGRQTRVATSPLAGGGFLAAWTSVAAGGPGSGIRALALTRDGEPRFTNRGCDAAPFALEANAEGEQFTPALALLPGDAVAASWTDAAGSGPDMSGTGIRGVVLSPALLFPTDD